MFRRHVNMNSLHLIAIFKSRVNGFYKAYTSVHFNWRVQPRSSDKACYVIHWVDPGFVV